MSMLILKVSCTRNKLFNRVFLFDVPEVGECRGPSGTGWSESGRRRDTASDRVAVGKTGNTCGYCVEGEDLTDYFKGLLSLMFRRITLMSASNTSLGRNKTRNILWRMMPVILQVLRLVRNSVSWYCLGKKITFYFAFSNLLLKMMIVRLLLLRWIWKRYSPSCYLKIQTAG